MRNTEPLRRELSSVLPERPFRVTFWDGSELPSTDGNGAPTLHVRSPRALAHALRSPGQLGIGRAYATGEIEPDDLDAFLLMLRRYEPPPIDRAGKLRLALAALHGRPGRCDRRPCRRSSSGRAASGTARSATSARCSSTTTSRTTSSSCSSTSR